VFSDYAAIPLDLPALPIDPARLRSFVQTHCEQCAFSRNQIRYVAFYARKPILKGRLSLYAIDQMSSLINGDTYFDWDPKFAELFPSAVEWFHLLPTRRLRGVILVTQTDHIPPHMDIYGQENSQTYFHKYSAIEPRNYRAILCEPARNSANQRSFYVIKDIGGRRRYVELPKDTNTFALNSSICYHGARHNSGSYKTTVVVHSTVDTEGHLSLLERSLKRYGNYAIRFPGAGPAQGPASEMPYRGSEHAAAR